VQRGGGQKSGGRENRKELKEKRPEPGENGRI